MSDTPRTDAFEALTERPINWWDFARELERENAALFRLIEDPNAMHAHYLRHLPGWEVWSTERIRNMDRDNARLERENAELRSALDQQANYQRELRADRDRLDWIARNRSVSIKERPLFVTPESLRAAIDTARKANP